MTNAATKRSYRSKKLKNNDMQGRRGEYTQDHTMRICFEQYASTILYFPECSGGES